MDANVPLGLVIARSCFNPRARHGREVRAAIE